MAGAMNSGPITSGRSSRNRDLGRGVSIAIAVMVAVPALWMLNLAPRPIEIAQLRLAHRELVPSAGRNAVERGVGRQFGGHLALRDSAVERPVQDVLGTEILDAVDSERKFEDGCAIEQLLGQEILRAESHRSALALNEIHRRRAE